MFDILDETSRGFSGQGTQLNIWDEDLKKYVLFLPLETIPSVVGSMNTFEHDVTTSPVIGKIKGKTTIDDKDVTFLWHRDNIARLNQFLGKTCKFLVSYPDGTGWKFTAEYTYKPNDTPSNDKTQGTITFISQETDTQATENVYDMIARTCFVTSYIDSEIHLKTSETKSYELTFSVATGATFEVSSDTSSITASKESGGTNKFKITAGSSADNAIVTIKSSATGFGSWKTHILVIVE